MKTIIIFQSSSVCYVNFYTEVYISRFIADGWYWYTEKNDKSNTVYIRVNNWVSYCVRFTMGQGMLVTRPILLLIVCVSICACLCVCLCLRVCMHVCMRLQDVITLLALGIPL